MHSKETEEIDRHIELALEIAKTDNKRAIALLELTLERSRSINYTHGIALSTHEMAACYDRAEMADKAMEYSQIALPLFISLGNKEGEARSYLLRAKSYATFGDSSKQAEYTFKGLEIAISIKNLRLQQKFYNNLGNYYQTIIGDIDKAIEYINISTNIAREMQDYRLLVINYNNLGINYTYKNEFDKAMDFLHLAEETNEKYVNDELHKSYCILYIGCVYFNQKKNDLALPCFMESLDISKRNGYWTGYCENVMMAGQLFISIEKFDEAIKILNEGIEIAKEKGIRRLLAILYSILSDVYEKKGSFTEALNYYEKFRMTRLEQISKLNEKNLESIKFLNHLEESQKESEILKEKNSEMFRINEQLIETDKEKNDFLGVVVHDLKNPLTNIILMAGNLKKNYEKLKPEKVISSFEKIYLSSERMLEIIDNLLDINKIESGNISLNIQEIKLKELIQRILSEFEIYSNQKNIKISLNTPEDTMINSDEMVVKEILMNLISNALKYSHKDSEVNINVSDSEGKAEIRISDNGLGIKEEEKQKVFQKFAKISNKPTAGENSTGLGLSIVKKLTELCGGKIDFESEFGKGTTFILNFQI